MQSREEAKNSQRSRPESATFLNYLETTSQSTQITPDHFIAHQLLGTGSFGEVYLVEKLSDKKLYAMKVLNKTKIKQ